MKVFATGGRPLRPPTAAVAAAAALIVAGCAFVALDDSPFGLSERLRFDATHPPYAGGDILFSHETHSFTRCSTCHFEPLEKTHTERPALPAMAVCFRCHDGVAASRDCITCHVTNRRERKPRFHDGLWPRAHKIMAERESYKCALCHLEKDCEGCHRVRKPLSHTPRFERSQHGRLAAADRRSCATCHESAFCENCHSQPPPDHTPTFMGFFAPDGTVRAGHKQAALLKGRACLTCHSFEDACRKCHG